MAPGNYADSQNGVAGVAGACVCVSGAAIVLFTTEFAVEDDSDGRTHLFLTLFLTYHLSIDTPILH